MSEIHSGKSALFNEDQVILVLHRNRKKSENFKLLPSHSPPPPKKNCLAKRGEGDSGSKQAPYRLDRKGGGPLGIVLPQWT